LLIKNTKKTCFFQTEITQINTFFLLTAAQALHTRGEPSVMMDEVYA